LGQEESEKASYLQRQSMMKDLIHLMVIPEKQKCNCLRHWVFKHLLR